MKTRTNTQVKTAKVKNVTVQTVAKTEVKTRRYVKKKAEYWNKKKTHANDKLRSNAVNSEVVAKRIKMTNESYIQKHFDIVRLLLSHNMSVPMVYRQSPKSVTTIYKVKHILIAQELTSQD